MKIFNIVGGQLQAGKLSKKSNNFINKLQYNTLIFLCMLKKLLLTALLYSKIIRSSKKNTHPSEGH